MKRDMPGRTVWVAGVLLLGLAAHASAQCSPVPLVPLGAAANDTWGVAVSASDDLLAVSGPGSGSFGEVALYRSLAPLFGWGEEQRLSGPVPGIGFGAAIDSFADTVAVGAPDDFDGGGFQTGAVYVFRKIGINWIQEAKLTPSLGQAADQFGLSVSVGLDRIAVGAPGNDQVGPDAGAATVFTRLAGVWSEQDVLTASDALPGDRFGRAIDLHDDVVLVGAPIRTGLGGAASGGAYIFRQLGPTYSEEMILEAPDALALDHFGNAVALSEGVALIGAPDQSGERGAAYVYRFLNPGWGAEQKLLISGTLNTSDRYGSAVAIEGDLAVVSAPAGDASFLDAGAMYVFRRGTGGWVQGLTRGKIAPKSGEEFGSAVALAGSTALVGAPQSSFGVGPISGAGFAIDLETAASQFYGMGWPGTFGVPTITLANEPVYGTTITVDITNSRGAPTVCAVFFGFAETSVPAFGGQLLVVPSITRVFSLPAAGLSIPFPLGACTTITRSFNRSYSYVQVIEADPGNPSGYSGSPGTQICPAQEEDPP